MGEEFSKTAIIVPARTIDLVKTLRSVATVLLIVGGIDVRYVADAEPYRSMEHEPQHIGSLGSEFGGSLAE